MRLTLPEILAWSLLVALVGPAVIIYLYGMWSAIFGFIF